VTGIFSGTDYWQRRKEETFDQPGSWNAQRMGVLGRQSKAELEVERDLKESFTGEGAREIRKESGVTQPLLRGWGA